jgi:hypothetical protein
MAQYTTNYDTLKTSVESYCEDDSSEFTAQFQNCVNRAEERIIRDLDLVVFNATLSTTTSTGVATYTKGFTDAPIISINFPDSSDDFAERRSYAYIQAHGGSGIPRYFYENETTVYWAPTPDASYTFNMTYISRPSKLTSSNTTNWLTRNVADLLIYGTLVEAETFLIAPERVQEFEEKYRQLLLPARAFWRAQSQNTYEPINPTPVPAQTR